jgi:hypothetical protein
MITCHIDLSSLVILGHYLNDILLYLLQGLWLFGGGLSTLSHFCGCSEKASYQAIPGGSWEA